MSSTGEFFIARGRGRGTMSKGPCNPSDHLNWRTNDLRRPNSDHGDHHTQLAQECNRPPRRGCSSTGTAEVNHRPLRRPYGPEEVGEQRRPNTAPEGNTSDQRQRPHPYGTPTRDSTTDPGGAGDIRTTSTLSPDAKPFYPSGYQSAVDTEAAGDATMEAVALKHITEVMRHLTKHPEMFDQMVTPLVDTFSSWLSDDTTVLVVVSALVDTSIEQSNFQFSGARLCKMLDHKYPTIFRAYLINKCTEEYCHTLEYLHHNPRHLQGFVLFTAELYAQVESGQRIETLGKIILDIIDQLIKVPSLENIKCVCHALKLVGQHLDFQNPYHMNVIYQCLRELTANPTLAPNVQLLTLTACELRVSNWGRNVATPKRGYAESQPTHLWIDGPVFYGPDGEVLTREESQFLQDNTGCYAETDDTEDDSCGENGIWEHDEEMDEEIQAAFHQFLTLGKESTNH